MDDSHTLSSALRQDESSRLHRARFHPPHRQDWWFPMPTMAPADSCPITLHVAMLSAVVKYDPHVGQVSPDKNVNCRYTTAAFTLSPESGASLCGANSPGDWALYAISVRRLIALHSGFLQTASHEDALAFG